MQKRIVASAETSLPEKRNFSYNLMTQCDSPGGYWKSGFDRGSEKYFAFTSNNFGLVCGYLGCDSRGISKRSDLGGNYKGFEVGATCEG